MAAALEQAVDGGLLIIFHLPPETGSSYTDCKIRCPIDKGLYIPGILIEARVITNVLNEVEARLIQCRTKNGQRSELVVRNVRPIIN
jgi:hypothetical protein